MPVGHKDAVSCHGARARRGKLILAKKNGISLGISPQTNINLLQYNSLNSQHKSSQVVEFISRKVHRSQLLPIGRLEHAQQEHVTAWR